MSKFIYQTDLTKNRLIKEYYNELQPDMDYDDFEKICQTPFKHFKKVLSDDNLYEFQFMYLGKFKVVPGYILNHLMHNERKKEMRSEKLYNYYKNLYKQYIDKFPEKFKKHKVKLKKWKYL